RFARFTCFAAFCTWFGSFGRELRSGTCVLLGGTRGSLRLPMSYGAQQRGPFSQSTKCRSSFPPIRPTKEKTSERNNLSGWARRGRARRAEPARASLNAQG